MTDLVPVARNVRLKLKDEPLTKVAEDLLNGIPQDEAPNEFPDVPAPLTATKEIREALRVLARTFNTTIVDDRRTLTDEELDSLGAEYEAIQSVLKLIKVREEQVKEYIRTHQDVEAEESGQAVPKDVVRNGVLITPATERDAKGHYILAAPKDARITHIPNSTKVFSNEFRSGTISEDLGWVERAYLDGQIDEKTWKDLTVPARVPNSDKIKTYVLRTGDVTVLEQVVRRGRDGSSLYFRSLRKS